MPFVSTIGFGGIVGFFAFFTFPGPVDRIETLGATNSIFALQLLIEFFLWCIFDLRKLLLIYLA
jgi:hypothetical protein